MAEIYYAKAKSPFLYLGSTFLLPTTGDLAQHYARVCRTPDKELQAIYFMMNNTPTDWIVKLPDEVDHTALSVGDVIYIEGDHTYHICLPHGWAEMH